MFLYEEIDVARRYGVYKELPRYIIDNLNPKFELRPYQQDAFRNFITYYEGDDVAKPLQLLFHMATGSGKTLVMSGLILYLYKHGYRNFMFFVSSRNILTKTKSNFLENTDEKYLFAEHICIDGETINIKEVSNFQDSDPDAINICFNTTQGLHTGVNEVKENMLSFEDFSSTKMVLISDEAHHLNANTKNPTKEEQEEQNSWEYTVNRIFGSNNGNVLLEFTATCDLNNAEILAKYERKIIFDYDLRKFRADKYSKEIRTMRSDCDLLDRCLIALVMSQYRLKVFQDNRLNIKPVLLFKSRLIKESSANMEAMLQMLENVDGNKIQELMESVKDQLSGINEAYNYFIANGISFEQLAEELRNDFSQEHCISANANTDVEEKQDALNHLESTNNPYRAVFAVDKLNEGWDVLNLFDIVRLYETRDGKNGVPGKGTVAEAQLIGRGARYCPFRIDNDQPKFQRKYDDDLDNPLRICETLYYHCWNESRYVNELHTALKGVGLDLDDHIQRRYVLKDEFRNDEVYLNGLIFMNSQVEKSRKEINGLLPSVRDKIYPVEFAVGKGGEDIVVDSVSNDRSVDTYVNTFAISDIASINYNTVYTALRQFDVYRFNTLKSYFPNLISIRDFITDNNYLGSIKIKITSKYKDVPQILLYRSCVKVLGTIANSINSMETVYEGTKEFYSYPLRDFIKSKTRNFPKTTDGGEGVSQNDVLVPPEYRLDLTQEEWFVFNDNYGTIEEKAFVAFFKEHVSELKEKYDKVYLIRNERHFHLFSFEGGERFEPDYLIFLKRLDNDGYDQLIVFAEPKGSHLMDKDKWKEDFLLQMEETAIPVTKFVDNNDYFIMGLHFFNREMRQNEFSLDFERLTCPEERINTMLERYESYIRDGGTVWIDNDD